MLALHAMLTHPASRPKAFLPLLLRLIGSSSGGGSTLRDPPLPPGIAPAAAEGEGVAGEGEEESTRASCLRLQLVRRLLVRHTQAEEQLAQEQRRKPQRALVSVADGLRMCADGLRHRETEVRRAACELLVSYNTNGPGFPPPTDVYTPRWVRATANVV